MRKMLSLRMRLSNNEFGEKADWKAPSAGEKIRLEHGATKGILMMVQDIDEHRLALKAKIEEVCSVAANSEPGPEPDPGPNPNLSPQPDPNPKPNPNPNPNPTPNPNPNPDPNTNPTPTLTLTPTPRQP